MKKILSHILIISVILTFVVSDNSILLSAQKIILVNGSSRVSSPDGSSARPFRRITDALRAAAPGSVIKIRGGVYRESLALKSGSPGKPFTITGTPGERVLLSGLKKITGWKKYRGKVYSAIINWRPERLLVNFQKRELSRYPNEGWWTAPSVKTDAIIDRAHLSGIKNSIAGAEAYVWAQYGNRFYEAPIKEFSAGQGRISFRKIKKTRDMKLKVGDRYFLMNSRHFIDRPGEWAVEETGSGAYRVYFWPLKSSDLSNVEAPYVKGAIIKAHKVRNVRITGLEIAGSTNNGIDVKYSSNIVIDRCIIHSNGYMGISGGTLQNITVKNCILKYNNFGIAVNKSSGIVIRENEIGENNVDGLVAAFTISDLLIERNYIHTHILWGHPDNLQVYRGVKNVRYIDNLIVNGGQSLQMGHTTGGVFRGNMVIGSIAFMVMFDKRSSGDFKIDNNTLAYSGYGCLKFTWKDYYVNENIFVTGHDGPAYSVKGVVNYRADRNIFWNARGLKSKSVLVSNKRRCRDLKTFQNDTGQDRRSLYTDPVFRNAPVNYRIISLKKIHLCTKNMFYLRKGAKDFKAGDNVEINFDGTVRRVVKVGSETITVSPGLSAKPIKEFAIFNWKGNGNFNMDLRVKSSSPAMKISRKKGRAVGSSISISQFKKGDFNGDGKRDIPDMPVSFK